MNRISITAAACLLSGAAAPAQSAVVVTIKQVGQDVVVSGSGTIDLDGLIAGVDGGINGHMWPLRGGLIIGRVISSTTMNNVTAYRGAIGPAVFGGGSYSLVDLHLGDTFGVINAFPTTEPGIIFVPPGYASGAFLSGSATYLNNTLASIGVTPGSYVYSWGDRSGFDTFTINVLDGVPEPRSWALMVGGFGLMGAAARRGKRAVAEVRVA